MLQEYLSLFYSDWPWLYYVLYWFFFGIFQFFRAAFVWELDDSEILLDPTGRLLITASSNKVHLSSNKDHIFSEYWGNFFVQTHMILGTKPIWCSNKIFGLWRWTSSIFTKDVLFTREQLINVYKIYIPERKKIKILMRLQIGFGPNIIRLDTSRMSMSEKTLKSKIKNPFCSIQLKIALNFFHWLCTCKNKFWIYEKLYVIMQT